MKNLLYCLMLTAFVLCSGNAFAEEKEELAPGYEACMRKAESLVDTAECHKRAHKFQSLRLDNAYKDLRKLCERGNNPKLCKDELKKLELAWLEFEKRMHVYMLNEGIFGPYVYEDTTSGDLAVPRGENYAEAFSANETKRQADRLELFYKLWERWQ